MTPSTSRHASTPAALLSAARPARRAAVLTKEGLYGAGVSGVVFAGPDDGGAWRTTLAVEPGGGSSRAGGVGVVVIEGALEQRAQFGLCEAYVDGYDAIESRYDAAIEAYKAGEIRKIVTVINSPGGVRQGLFSTVRRVRAKIEAAGVPTEAVADEDCCSAAWAWALVSDKLFAPPDARVGSIGAVTIAESIAGKLEKEGREVRVYRSGERKMRPSGVEPFTSDDDAELQARADAGGVLIADWTAERRGGTREEYLALKGAVFSGQEAARRGLIDGLFTAHEVIDMALSDAARAEIAEALGLPASATEAEIKQKASALRADGEALTVARSELDAARRAQAKAEADRMALEERTEREKAQSEASKKRSAFASEVRAACDAGLITPPREVALLAYYDKHGESAARDTFAEVKASAPIVKRDKVGAIPAVSSVGALTEAQKARAKELGVSEDEYAAGIGAKGGV